MNGTTDEMLTEGRKLARIHKNVVVKVPLTRDGIRACSAFGHKGIRVNVTLCAHRGASAWPAPRLASFVSPFVGRIDDSGWNGMELIHDIADLPWFSRKPSPGPRRCGIPEHVIAPPRQARTSGPCPSK